MIISIKFDAWLLIGIKVWMNKKGKKWNGSLQVNKPCNIIIAYKMDRDGHRATNPFFLFFFLKTIDQ